MIKKVGLINYKQLVKEADVLLDYILSTIKAFHKSNYVDNKGIADAGVQALSPYRVNNAIIMADGMSSRFVPISLKNQKNC